MAKLIKLLAVSVGSGFLLGAGIRAGAAMAGAVADAGALSGAFSGANTATDEPVAPSGPLEEALEQRLAAFEQSGAALEDRINRKLARLETDLAGQMSALTELRECSLRNEETVRRLLATLERLIGSELARTPGPVRTPRPLEPSAV
jgi:flagellar motility protein MotE (MotC chaperone)